MATKEYMRLSDKAGITLSDPKLRIKNFTIDSDGHVSVEVENPEDITGDYHVLFYDIEDSK